MNMNREELIESINCVPGREVLLKTDLFHRPVFVKTSKTELVRRIRREFAENEMTNLRFRSDNNVSVLEPVEMGRPISLEEVARRVSELDEPEPVKRGPGRPKGSRNKKPKMVADQFVNPEDAPVKRGPGRPKGSKNKPKMAANDDAMAPIVKRRPGRPKGSKNKPKVLVS